MPLREANPGDGPARSNDAAIRKTCSSCSFWAGAFKDLSGEDKYNQVQLMTMSAIDFLDQWFETDVLKATMSASGIIGTFLGVRSPGTAYVLLHHYMGEIDGAFRAWGFARGGTGAISNAIADAAREAGAEIKTQAGVTQISDARWKSRRRGDHGWRRVLCTGHFLQRRPESHVPEDA